MARQGKEPREEATIKALTHPLRVDLLIRLAEVGKLSARQYEKETGEELNLVAYHLRVLEKYGAIELVDTRPNRGAVEHFWAIARDSPIIHALLGSQLSGAEGQRDNGSSGILGGVLGSAKGQTQVSLIRPIELDATGIEELQDAVDGGIAEILNDVGQRVQERLRRTGSRGNQFHIGFAAFTWDRGQGFGGNKKRPKQAGGS